MIRARIIAITMLIICASSGDCYSLAQRAASLDAASIASIQTPPRVALIGFAGGLVTGKLQSATAQRKAEEALRSALKRDGRVAMIEPSLVQPALAGIGYSGSINQSKDEARRLGAAIGCDFFITGKAEALTRSERQHESHEEAYAGVMIVDGRTGALALFDFIAEKASTREAAVDGVTKILETRTASYVDQVAEYRARRAVIQSPAADDSSSERIEDLPDEGSPQAALFAPPQFFNRVKPEYTEEANRADISATVEARAVFRANGEVGDVEIIRWAGFGLDEAAERAIRQLKFKPAARDGKAVSVRALVQYNFRRVAESVAKPAPPETRKPDETPVRDLRELLKSKRRPPR